MQRIMDLSNSLGGNRFLILMLLILSLTGCTVARKVQVRLEPYPSYPEEKIERNDFAIKNGEDVIGRQAFIRIEKGDTLPDLARHFGLGVNAVSAANPGMDIWVPKPGELILLPMSFILPDAARKGIVINLPAMRLFYFQDNGKGNAVSTYPIGIGTAERPTPMGKMNVARKVTKPTWYVPFTIAEDHRKKGDPLPPAVLPGPDNPLGDYALYLSKPTYLIHGTNKPASIGLRATNGCIRLYPENIKKLYEKAAVQTPVSIVSQPYLIGKLNGEVYLQVYSPNDDSGADELEKIYARLKDMEKKYDRAVDWSLVKKTIDEARGIPVPVFVNDLKNVKQEETNIELTHPVKLYGKPEVPELRMNAWYVLAAVLREEADALRLAEMINHQGPHIPARVLSKNDKYRVVAGPFHDIKEADDVVRRLKFDLELDGIVIEPAKK